MRTSDFDYDLPPELIAQTPVKPRDASRLLVLDRATGRAEHRRFTDVLEYLHPGDLMVFNQSRVIPARLFGTRDDNGGRVEFLLLRREAGGVWEAMARPGRRLRPGTVVTIIPPNEEPPPPQGEERHLPPPQGEGRGGGEPLTVEILESRPEGLKAVRLSSEEAIEGMGHTPLPPYIRQTLEDSERYQTVYAREPGSAAAPTAGLHFTPELLARIRESGVNTAFVTLHVGLDTFRPVQGEDPAAHHIHTERYSLDAVAADALNRARTDGRRIIAVGTTSVRVLEQAAADAAAEGRAFEAVEGNAGIYILPGHEFRAVNAMLTNFHLPRSTLLMLVSAFAQHGADGDADSGRRTMLGVYDQAVRLRYRFYSFGDAMMVL